MLAFWHTKFGTKQRAWMSAVGCFPFLTCLLTQSFNKSKFDELRNLIAYKYYATTVFPGLVDSYVLIPTVLALLSANLVVPVAHSKRLFSARFIQPCLEDIEQSCGLPWYA